MNQDIKVEQTIGKAGTVKAVEFNIQQYSYLQARPQDLSRAFDSFIADRTKDFVGRQFVFDALDKFMSDPQFDSGYFIIKGEPGIGKSAIMAQLVKTRGLIHHFNIALQSINKPKHFLQSICAQLIAKFSLDHKTWPPDADKDGAFLNQLLSESSEKLAEGEKLLIGIDALDEVDMIEIPESANVLYLPQSLPEGVFFVVTTRHKFDIRVQVINSESLDIEAASPNNQEDARQYIESRLSDDKIQQRIKEWEVTEKEFVDTILKKSEANFMYLKYVLLDIRKGDFKEGKLDELPDTLIGYYRRHWKQMKSKNAETFEKFQQSVVCVLATVKEAISINQVSNFTDLEFTKIRDVIREWFEFLYEEFSEEQKPLYRIYHSSFQEFLQEEVDPGLKKYHEMIVQYYTKLVGKVDIEKLG